jgi:SAM-dependent methyltransferase
VSKVDFDDYSGNYNELLHEQTSFFSTDEEYFARYKVELARAMVTRAVPRILEYGCGVGRNIPFLCERFPGSTVYGSDISPRSLDVARRSNPGVAFWIEGQEAPPVSQFDLVFVAGVFHHIPPPDRGAALNALFDRTAQGGRVVVFEHNPFNPVTRRIVRDCPYDGDAVLVRPSEMKRGLQQAGYTELGSGFSLFFPPKLGRLVRAERLLRWLPLGGQYWVTAVKQ